MILDFTCTCTKAVCIYLKININFINCASKLCGLTKPALFWHSIHEYIIMNTYTPDVINFNVCVCV